MKRPQPALELYKELKDTITCTKVTYNTLIDSLVRQNDMGSATELFRDMALEGVAPDLITYSTLIKGHCLQGDLEQGLQLMGLMQRRGIAPDAVLFNSILDGCAHKQMRTLTETVLRDMENAGVVPSNHTLSILVKLYGRCGDLTAAFNVIETYPKKFGFNVNAQVYTCVMSACIANGDQMRALTLYDTMVAAGCAADAKTFQTLLKGCVRHNDVDGASRLVNDVFCKDKASSMFSASADRQTLEGILLMAVRQGRSSDVAMPMLQRFHDANIWISDRVCNAVRGR
jgi:pentatricopeptide repeat protein